VNPQYVSEPSFLPGRIYLKQTMCCKDAYGHAIAHEDRNVQTPKLILLFCIHSFLVQKDAITSAREEGHSSCKVTVLEAPTPFRPPTLRQANGPYHYQLGPP
jgi:hypothetical protein